jgi:hypothetical protein
MKNDESTLKAKAIQYLKDAYGEDTVSMDVIENGVENGNGVLFVECTVSMGHSESDWYKQFTFRNGVVTNMKWQQR